MPKAKMQAAALGGSSDDVEAAFYEALQSGDIEQLMACWAEDDEVVCVHPGGQRLIGTSAIRASFESMFANGAIHAHPTRVRKVLSLACVMHSVLERIEILTPKGPAVAYVLATNVYHKAAEGWRMVAHHASPGSPSDDQDVQAGAQPVLH